jgi:DNA-binding PadR family transcriptional regulator
MSLKYVLLGFLTYGPESGYSLRKRFFQPGMPKLSQVYRTLKEMAAEGLVTSHGSSRKSAPRETCTVSQRKERRSFSVGWREPGRLPR